MNELTDDELNKAVAEWMGMDKAEPRYRFTYWSKSSPPILCGGFITMDGAVRERKELIEQGFYVSDEVWEYQPLPDIPNYTGCLNAIALAEQRLTTTEQQAYANELCHMLNTGSNGEFMSEEVFATATANARQRSLALLRVVRPSPAAPR